MFDLIGRFCHFYKPLMMIVSGEKMKTSDIQIRDPYIYTDQQEKMYYMFGTTDQDCWCGPGQGFDCYKSKDLQQWEGPIPAFRPTDDFWGKENFWAPEVHKYIVVNFTYLLRSKRRSVTVLRNSGGTSVFGPYIPLTDEPATPQEWQCLDGTLYVDENGDPWIVFCHEWVQIHNGAICATRLSPDLRKAVGRPHFLFNAAEAPG
ncbi:MAG: family 43 glycosylhydrolase [Chloroflexota bacterium]